MLTIFLLCSVRLSPISSLETSNSLANTCFCHQGDWVGNHSWTSSRPSPPIENGSNHMARQPGATHGIRADKGIIIITDKARAAGMFSVSSVWANVFIPFCCSCLGFCIIKKWAKSIYHSKLHNTQAIRQCAGEVKMQVFQ